MENRGKKRAAQDSKTRRARPEPRPPVPRIVPEIYEVVIECRHEAEQRAVYERMCGEGYRCRVITL
jgi:hypothetical protein